MKNHVWVFAVLLAVGLRMTASVAEEATDFGDVKDRETIRVMDIAIISTNQVLLGTRTVSLVAATNFMVAHRDTLDVVVVHDPAPGSSSSEKKAPVLATIAGAGVPVVIVEKEGEYAWRKQSAVDGVRTVKVGTADFAALRRLWKGEKLRSVPSSAPVVETTMGWDTATGTYELSRVELGLFGKRVWIMHEQRESDEGGGTVGIQLRKGW